MAGMRINTEQVGQIAADIEAQNNQLAEQLQQSRDVMTHLINGNIWEGEAAQTTLGAFNQFADKYFQNYKDVIDQYVKFLRVNVEQGYFDTETQNITLADAFK